MARRVNTRFVWILGAAALGVVAVVFAAQRLIKPGPDQFITAAKQAESNNQWKEAAANWKKAVDQSPRDPALFVSLGNALRHVGMTDPEIRQKEADRAAWEHALEVDPTYVPAVKSLVSYWRERVQRSNDPANLRSARDRAEQLHRLAPDDPDDNAVEVFLDTVTIEAWMSGVDTDPARLDEAQSHLKALMLKDPANAELPFELANIDIHLASQKVQDSNGASQPAAATTLFNKAAGEMEAALKSQSQNARMHFRAALVYEVLGELDHSGPEVKAKYLEKQNDQIDLALGLVKPSDQPSFDEISYTAAMMAQQQGNIPRADGIVRQLLKEHADDVMTNVRYAPLLSKLPEPRGDAIGALKNALATGAVGNAVDYARGALTDLEVAELQDPASIADKAKLRDDIGQNLRLLPDASVKTSAFDTVRRTKDTAALMASQGDNIGTIEAYTRGMAGDLRVSKDPEILWGLANAYDKANEREQAVEYIQKTIEQNPNFLPAREELVRHLLTQGTVRARQEINRQMDVLVRAAPNDADVIELELTQLDPASDKDRIKALYARLPEQTVEQQRKKSAMAVSKLQDVQEGIRLFKMIVDAKPGDANSVSMLAQMYAQVNQVDDAIAVIKRGLAVTPDNGELQVNLKILQNASPDEIRKLQTRLVDTNPDPFAREIGQADEAERAGDSAGIEKHLRLAEGIKPNDPTVWNRLFQYYLGIKAYDKADPYLKKLGDANIDEAHGMLYQFRVAQARGDVDRQLEIGRELITQYPLGRSYYTYGQAWQAKGDYQQAIENYDVALEKTANLADAVIAKIDCYYLMNRMDSVRVAINEGRRRFPDNPALVEMQIRYEVNYGDPQHAADMLDNLARGNPDNAQLLLELALAEERISQVQARIPNLDAAQIALNNARSVLNSGLQKFPDDLQFYREMAHLLESNNDAADAEKVLLALEARPKWQKRYEPQVLLADLYAGSRQPEKAQTAWETAMIRSGQDIGVEIRFAGFLTQEKKYDPALKLLGDTNKDDPRIRRQRIVTLAAAGRAADAQAGIQELLDKNPPDASALNVQWAELEIQAGKLDTAASHLAQALAIDPHNVDALYARGSLKLKQSPIDFQGAVDDLNQAHQFAPARADILSALADAYMTRLDVDRATVALAAALRADPANIPLALKLAQIYANVSPVRLDQAMRVLKDAQVQSGGAQSAELAVLESRISQAQGDIQNAVAINDAALQRIPNDPSLIRMHLELLVASSQFDAALQQANGLIEQNAQLPWLWTVRGQAKAALGDKPGGLADLKQGLAAADAQNDAAGATQIMQAIAGSLGVDAAIDCVKSRAGKGMQWRLMLVSLYQQKGDDAAALSAVQPLLDGIDQLSSADKIHVFRLAGPLYATAQPAPYADKAYAVYKQWLELNPNDLEALNDMACLCADGFSPPKIEEGLTYIHKAMDLITSHGTADPLLTDTYGWLLILGGNPSEGVAALRRVIDQHPFPEAYYHLAQGYLRLNRPDDARKEVNLALTAMTKQHEANKPVRPDIRDKILELSGQLINAGPDHASNLRNP